MLQSRGAELADLRRAALASKRKLSPGRWGREMRKPVELTLDLAREPEFVGRPLIEIAGITPEHGPAFRADVDVLVVSGSPKPGM